MLPLLRQGAGLRRLCPLQQKVEASERILMLWGIHLVCVSRLRRPQMKDIDREAAQARLIDLSIRRHREKSMEESGGGTVESMRLMSPVIYLR
jgi:hypothetical protein